VTGDSRQTVRFDFSGRLVVVTGASRGIGAAVATTFARAGATVVGVARSLPVDAPVAEGTTGPGGVFHALSADLADRGQTSTLHDRILGFGVPDVLVHCAGTLEQAEVDVTDMESWDRVLEVNLNAGFLLARDLGSRMRERGSGKVVFIASMLSFQGGDRVVSYTASKTALRGLTAALANAWAGDGVNVNAVAPGYIVSDNTAPLLADDRERTRIDGRIPAGRWGEPHDVVGAVLFLASSAADYVHGITMPVDGGWLAR
jgi:2-deoxy-D-gluconate 3-dehydrogenase